jgi:hypothetical protein
MKKIYLLVCTLIFSVTVNAGLKTWVGGATGDWQWAANWSPQGYPGPTDDLIIENAIVNLYGSAIVKSIALEGTAQLIVWPGPGGNTILSIPQPATGIPAISLNTGTKLKVYGTLNIGGGATANIPAGIDASDADISIEYGGKISIDRCQFGVYLSFGSTLTNDGNLEIGQGSTITNRGIYMDEATLQNNGYGIIKIDNVQGPAIATNTTPKPAGLRTINNSGTIYIGDIGNVAGAGISATDAAVNNSGYFRIDNQTAKGMDLIRGTLINGGTMIIKSTAGDGLQLTGGSFTNNSMLRIGHNPLGGGNVGSGNIAGIGIHTNGTVVNNNGTIDFGIVSRHGIQLENNSFFTNSWNITGDDPWGYIGITTAISDSMMVVDHSTFINAASGTYNANNSTYNMTVAGIVVYNAGHAENRGTIKMTGPHLGLSLDGNSDFKNYGFLEAYYGFIRTLYLAGGSRFDNSTGGTVHFGGTLTGGTSLIYITGNNSLLTNTDDILVNYGNSHGIEITQNGSLLNNGAGLIKVENIQGNGIEITGNGQLTNNAPLELNQISNIPLHVSGGNSFFNNSTLNIGNNSTNNSKTGILIEGTNTALRNNALGQITINYVPAAYNGIEVTTGALLRNTGKITWGMSTVAFAGAAALKVVTGAMLDNRVNAILEFANCTGDAIAADVSGLAGGSSLTFNGIVKFGNITGRGIYNTDPNVVLLNKGSFETLPDGKMDLYASMNNSGPASVLTNDNGIVNFRYPSSNSGTITNGRAIFNRAAFSNASGGQINNNGAGIWNMVGTFDNNLNSICRGTGTFRASVFRNNGGTIAPGNSAGCMNMSDGFNQSSGTLDIEVNGKNTPCTEFDRLNVTGTATLSGALKVTFGGGYTAAIGDIITILKSTALSGTFSSNNLPAGWNVLYNYPATGDVTLNRGGLIPLTLLDFNAEKAGEKAKLSWTTTDEINTDHFELQKSNDGTQFQKLATIPAMNMAGNHHYQFTDPLPLPGRSYYRLQMIDIDGQYTYSRIASLDFGKAQTLISAIYPNPVKDIVNIAVAEAANNQSIQLISQDGKIILTKQLTARGVYQLDLSALPAGIYLVKTSTGEIYKLVKQ